MPKTKNINIGDVWKDWDVAHEVEMIERGISNYFSSNSFEKGVVGVSGGLDSAVSTSLAVRALGHENVICLLLPDDEVTPEQDTADALGFVENLGVEYHIINITPIIKAYSMAYPKLVERNSDGSYKYPNAFGNVKARIRMITNYSVGQTDDSKTLVIGTTDKSELLMGYCTKYGDSGVDIEPIDDYYKTQVKIMGQYLKVPENILRKKPSPRLIPGNDAEKELGIAFKDLDFILYHLVDLAYTKEQMVDEYGIDSYELDRISRRIAATEHKRRMPPGTRELISLALKI